MRVTLDSLVDTLKAAAESSRLRILALLSRGDLTVSDLTEILNQSQPRVSRHLKLLLEAGLIGRYQEGSWAFFRVSDSDVARDFVHGLVARVHDGDPQIERDLERLVSVKRKRQERATEYFSENAASWDEIRSLHVPDRAVETALIYQDAWDDNTQARAVNAELLNNLITARNLFNELLQARMQMNLSKTSETAKTLKPDSKVDPYNCDPVILEEMKVPREDWPRCAVVAAADADTEILSSGGTDRSIGNNLLSIQNAANAAD